MSMLSMELDRVANASVDPCSMAATAAASVRLMAAVAVARAWNLVETALRPSMPALMLPTGGGPILRIAAAALP